MSPSVYSLAWPILRRTSPERAHSLALHALRLPFALGRRAPDDPFEWRGIRFRGRVGIAAGLDKDARCVAGIERLGAGFVEVGTVLAAPCEGAPVRPRMKRLLEERGVWNRIGFQSDGLERVARRLARVPLDARRGMVVACNIGPHPKTVRAIGEDPTRIAEARAELELLARSLHAHADLFVLNLSSPNTPGLRALMQAGGFARELVEPLVRTLSELEDAHGRALPLLMKLPPEDGAREPWTRENLAALLDPMLAAGVAGVVAVNTSIGLARRLVPDAEEQYPGGVSGAPLLPLAIATMELLRELLPPELLRIGVGGITRAGDARQLIEAGAQLVELYSGLVYGGPGLLRECSLAISST